MEFDTFQKPLQHQLNLMKFDASLQKPIGSTHRNATFAHQTRMEYSVATREHLRQKLCRFLFLEFDRNDSPE